MPAAAITIAATTPPSRAMEVLLLAGVEVAVVVTTLVTVVAGKGEISVVSGGLWVCPELNCGELPATLAGTAPGPFAIVPELAPLALWALGGKELATPETP